MAGSFDGPRSSSSRTCWRSISGLSSSGDPPAQERSLALWDGLPPLVLAAVLTLRLVRRRALPVARRWAWICLGAGMVFDFAGSTMLALHASEGTAQFAGAANLVYWLSYPLFALAMGMFFVDAGGSFRRPLVWVDAAMPSDGARSATTWEFLGRPHLDIFVTEPGTGVRGVRLRAGIRRHGDTRGA